MKIRTFFSLDNNVYRVVIRTEDWSEGDVRRMEKYGEPEINVGGAFVSSMEYLNNPVFELDGDYRRVKSESPFSQGFDKRDTVDAEAWAELWATTIKARITSAVTTLRQLDDPYSREEVTTL